MAEVDEPSEPQLRRRKTPPDKKLPPIVEKADDLEALKKTVEDATSVSGGLWLSYLFVLFYIAVAAGAVTHADLLLETPVKLPFLNDISLPLKAFFLLAPFLFLIMHAYTLAHFVLLADKVRRFHDQLHQQIAKAEEIREALRRQLPCNIFVQFLAGPKDIRVAGPGWLLKVTAWTTLVFGPILLLLLLQIQFLPYHDTWITWTHRLALLADFLLLLWLWPKILRSRDDLRGWRRWTSLAKSVTIVILGMFAILFSWTVATIPGEWNERPLSYTAIIDPTSINAWFFYGDVDDVTRRRVSWFSNTLVLPGFNIYEALKIDDPKKLEVKDNAVDLRGRRLDGAVFDGATLKFVDLTGAQLQGASLRYAQLQGASLWRARLQGATLYGAQLQGASLDGAQLQGASLWSAQLQGASLNDAQLQGALLWSTQLQGASLDRAQLRGASIYLARLGGASLVSSDLTAVRLESVILWRANFDSAKLESLSVKNLRWAAEKLDEHYQVKPWSEQDYLDLKAKLERSIPAGNMRTLAINRIEILDCQKKGEQVAPCDPKIAPSLTAEKISKASVDSRTYSLALVNSLHETICGANGDVVHILHRLLQSGRIMDTGASAPELVDRILSKDCALSAKLSQNDNSRLRAVATRAAELAAKEAMPMPTPKAPAKQN